MRVAAMLAIVLAAVGVASASAGVQRRAAPAAERLIDCACYDLFRIQPNGSGRKLLSTGGSRDLMDVSADRTHLLYQHFVGELDVSTVTGSDAHRLVGSIQDGVGPGRFSPDGRLVAYAAPLAGCPTGAAIHVIGVDGRNDRVVSGGCTTGVLAWSPDAGKIAFVRVPASHGPAAPTQLVVLDIDSGANRVVARSLGTITSPEWSPDGSRIAFVGDGKKLALHVVRADGTRDLAIAPGAAPTWSPNGRLLEYAWDRPGKPQVLAVIARNGTHNHVLDPASIDPYGQGVGWSPDGRTIVYRRSVRVAKNDYREELAVAHPDGTHRRRLLRGVPNEEFGPLYWTPSGRAVIYTRYVQRGE
jgi:Tol biopolymer transport system component